ncbi:MFS transporter [Streptomyces sp. NBC_00338]|uniref:MFS transporter n=1 Tax=Streptomyces sp. NBC_00338 TaxID=2975715 RepID=UPI00225C1729|nr:MFS transporter [Streptomyces sp. NBC_00338]MCX5140006.1 MFS transporter [Streptomyces sp. NBC_00338]
MSPYAPKAPGLSRSALYVLCACVLVAQSMVAAINLLIPQLASSALRPSSSELLWAVDAYVIVFAGLLIPAGALGDRFGRKGVLLAGLGLFAAGSATSALATAPAALIAGRGVCGAGAALIMPATMSILVTLATPGRRAQALATWTLAVGLGGLAGNVGGGLVGQFLSWRALFWAMVPLAALLALAVARIAPRTPAQTGAAPDPVGSLLLTGSLTALVYGIIEGPSRGWGSVHVLIAFGLGAVLLAVFVVHGLRAAHPLLDPRVFASPGLRAGVLGTAAGFFGLFALFYVNSQYLQYVKGFSVGLAGVAIVPLTVGMALVPRLGARWLDRYGIRPVAGGGLALIGVGLLLLSTADAGTPYAVYAVHLLVISAGTGLCAPALTVAVVSELPAHRSGLGSGLNTAAREIGAALGVAVVGTVLASGAGPNRPAAARAADFVPAMAEGLRVVAAVLLVATVFVVLGTSGRPRSAPTLSADGAPAADPREGERETV